ncbi:MAG: hypothetical protein ACRCYE_01430, partial [Sarcina sp.]
MKEINLEFDSSLSRLAGNSFGEKIYIDQVMKKINFEKKEKIKIIFPNNIKDIAISFVQGFINRIS